MSEEKKEEKFEIVEDDEKEVAIETEEKEEAKEEESEEKTDETPDFSAGFDYSEILDDNDVVSVGGKKLKWGEIKNKFENLSIEKKAEIAEENPKIKKEIEKAAEQQSKDGSISEENLTEEQQVLIKLLQREYIREWEAIKDKYPLVDFEDVIAKLQVSEEKDPSQVEVVAKKLQAYFDKKLELKEKQKLEMKRKAEETNFNVGESPTPTPKGEEEVPDIDDTSAFVNAVKGFFRKK